MSRSKRSHCPIAYALDIVGDRWSLLILRDLLFKDKQRYNEFLASDEGISTNILSARLARLEAEGLIRKARDKSDGRQYIYSPTRKGLDLLPAILEISCWSANHDPNTAAPSGLIRRIRADRAGFIRALSARFQDPTTLS